METYLLATLCVLILIILAALYLINKQLISIRIKVNSNSFEIDKFKKTNNSIYSNMFNDNNVDLVSKLIGGEEDSDEESEHEKEVEDEESEHEKEVEDEESEQEEDVEDEESEHEEDVSEHEEELVEDVSEDEKISEIIDELTEDNVSEINMTSDGNFSIKKKKVPNQSAKNFEIGYNLLSENDNKLYEVTSDKNGRKRWKKIN